MRLTKTAFDNKFRHLFFKASASNSFLEWHAVSKPDNESYVPGDNNLISGAMLNTWVEGGVDAEVGDWSLIQALLENLFPNAEEQSHVIDLLAFLLQKPGQKVSHMAIIRGIQGSGKSTLSKLVAGLVGDNNVKVINGHALVGTFHAVLMECQVLIIEEASLNDRREVGNRMKQLVTDRNQRVEEKYQPIREARTPDLIFVISNEQAPLPLEDGDRRGFVAAYGRTKLEPDFYNRLYDSLHDELPGFKTALLKRDLSMFSPAAPPPMTAAKLEVIEWSHLEIEQQISLMIEEQRPPFNLDVVIPGVVAARLQQDGHHGATGPRVSKALRTLSATNLRQLAPGGPWIGAPRVYAIRNHSQWEGATAAQLRNYLMSGHSLRSIPDGPEDVVA